MKLTSTLVCLSTAAIMTVGAASPALAEPSKAIQLSWDGGDYGDTTTESFVGFPVAVPGDSTERTLMVRNEGATDGTLHVSITNVDLLEPEAEDLHHNPNHTAPNDSGHYTDAGDQGDFYADLLIDWNGGRSSIKELDAAGDTQILRIDLPRGETTPVTIGYELPIDSTAGNKANVDPRLGKFDVVLSLGGDSENDGGAEEGGAEAVADDKGNTADADSSGGTDAHADSASGSDGNDGNDSDDSVYGQGGRESSAVDEAESAVGATGDSGAEAGGSLPRTGGLMWWTAVLGVILAGSGAAMTAATRRKSEAH